MPQATLVAGAVYRIEARLWRESPTPAAFPTQTSADYRFQIVAPTNPADGAYQLTALVNSTQTVRTYAVASVAAVDTFTVRAQGVVGRIGSANVKPT